MGKNIATKKYHDLLNNILTNGYEYDDPNRKDVTRKELFCQMLQFDLSESLPFITSKPIWLRGIWKELQWMLSGQTNIKYLQKAGVHVWDKDAYNYAQRMGQKFDFETFLFHIKNNTPHRQKGYELGDIGPSYGAQLRGTIPGLTVDQVELVLKKLMDPKTKYASDLLVSVWNPVMVDQVALKPCHHEFQFNVRTVDGDDYLDLQFSMRSSDAFLGLPWNIAYYTYLLLLFSEICGFKAGVLTYFGKKVHLYNNQFDAALKQIKTDISEYNEPAFIMSNHTLKQDIFLYKEGMITLSDLILNTEHTDLLHTGYNFNKEDFAVEMLAYSK